VRARDFASESERARESEREREREGAHAPATARVLFQGIKPMLEESITAKLSCFMHQDALVHGKPEAKHSPGLIGSAWWDHVLLRLRLGVHFAATRLAWKSNQREQPAT
jgi:hypothetical protein